MDASILESVGPEDFPHLRTPFQTLYDMGDEFGKRVWTDLFETLLPAKLKFPQFAEKSVKSMMFDPDFMEYHQVRRGWVEVGDGDGEGMGGDGFDGDGEV